MKSREHIESVNLIYTDTDSLGYEINMNTRGFTHEDLFSKTFLSHHLDRSNFKVLDKTKGANPPGGLGLLKSEIGDSIPLQCICLSPKCYSIKTVPRQNEVDVNLVDNNIDGNHIYKQAIKGCPRRAAKRYCRHSEFQKILRMPHRQLKVSSNHIRYNKKVKSMVTISQSRTPLSLFDNKRFWINFNFSVAYGHPLSYKHGFKDGDILTSRGGYIKETKDLLYGNGDENMNPECDDLLASHEMNSQDGEHDTTLDALYELYEDEDECNSINFHNFNEENQSRLDQDMELNDVYSSDTNDNKNESKKRSLTHDFSSCVKKSKM